MEGGWRTQTMVPEDVAEWPAEDGRFYLLANTPEAAGQLLAWLELNANALKKALYPQPDNLP